MVKSLPKIVYQGSKILVKSLYRAIQEEIQMSKEAAKIRYSQVEDGKCKKVSGISLEEAKNIINVSTMDKDEIEKKYNFLFNANDPSKGGSFYLQSKIFRAKQKLDAELKYLDSL